MMIDFSKYVPDIQCEQIPIKNLVSNQEYQRNLSKIHIRKMVADFDVYQVNFVKVSRRDELNFIMNGQHTVETVAEASGSRETPVWCMVFHGLTYEDEARIFANQQQYVKGLSAYEIFSAKIEAGNDDQLLIRDLVSSYGLTLAQSSKCYCVVCAIASLEQIYMKLGFHALDRTLRLIVGAWEGDPLSLSSNMLKGVAKLVTVFGDYMKDDVFCDRLGKVSAREIARTAKERREGSLGFTETILTIYNKKAGRSLNRALLYGDNLQYNNVHEFSAAGSYDSIGNHFEAPQHLSYG